VVERPGIRKSGEPGSQGKRTETEARPETHGRKLRSRGHPDLNGAEHTFESVLCPLHRTWRIHTLAVDDLERRSADALIRANLAQLGSNAPMGVSALRTDSLGMHCAPTAPPPARHNRIQNGMIF